MNKITKTMLAVITWAVIAFCMSILYYWLKTKGIIWDEPDYIKLPDGTIKFKEFTWNSRKLIFGIVSLTSLAMLVISIINIWDDKFKK